MFRLSSLKTFLMKHISIEMKRKAARKVEKAYQIQHQALRQIKKLIVISLVSSNIMHIEDLDSAYEKLKALKMKLTITNLTKRYDIRPKYIQLFKIGNMKINE